MKSDELYIAEIYEKAKWQKKEENTKATFYFRGWQELAAVACLCLIIAGALSVKQQADKDRQIEIAQQENTGTEITPRTTQAGVNAVSVQGVSAASFSESIQENVTVTAEVISFAASVGPVAMTADAASESGAALTILLDEEYRDIDIQGNGQLQVWVSDESLFEAGEHVKLTLVSVDGQWKVVSAEHDEQEKED